MADGFYEFTAHQRQVKAQAQMAVHAERCAAVRHRGLWRADAAVGEAFTILTCEPAPDIAPYHNRSIVILPPRDWSRWLDPSDPSSDLLTPPPAGSLGVEQVARSDESAAA